MSSFILEVASIGVQSLAEGTFRDVLVRGYWRNNLGSGIKREISLSLIYQDEVFWLVGKNHKQHLFDSKIDNETCICYIIAGDYELAAQLINEAIKDRLCSDMPYDGMHGFYIPVADYLESRFLRRCRKEATNQATNGVIYIAVTVDEENHRLPVSDWYIAIQEWDEELQRYVEVCPVRIGDVRKVDGERFSALKSRGQLMRDMMNELNKRYRERLFPKVA